MRQTRRLLKVLQKRGLLLKQDPTSLNVVSLLLGESLRTSWWSHPEAHTIFRILSEMVTDPSVLTTKLVAGKDTLVHRRLWPALLAVGLAGEPWQLRGLGPNARTLFNQVRRVGTLRSRGPAARQLLVRVLVNGWEVHTEAGRHELVLESWAHWARRLRQRRCLVVANARVALERAAMDIGADLDLLPWRRWGEP
jgi:hypothetical protein